MDPNKGSHWLKVFYEPGAVLNAHLPSQQPYGEQGGIIPILLTKKLRSRGIKLLIEVSTASK